MGSGADSKSRINDPKPLPDDILKPIRKMYEKYKRDNNIGWCYKTHLPRELEMWQAIKEALGEEG